MSKPIKTPRIRTSPQEKARIRTLKPVSYLDILKKQYSHRTTTSKRRG